MKRTDLCPPRADLFRSRGPLVCNGRTYVPRSRTVFIHWDPEWTFLVTRASRADHSRRERTFCYCLRGTGGHCSIKLTDLCPPRADLFRSRGPFTCYVQTSDPRSRTVFIHQDLEWIVLVTRASREDHSLRERTFFYCLLGTCGQNSIKRTDLCPPRANFFRSYGPLICYWWTSVPRSRIIFIYRDPEWTFLVTRASRVDHSLCKRTFFIACVAHVDSILSNARKSARRVRAFFVLADL